MVAGMHVADSHKQTSPDKWLADLLSKALLLEYQQPLKGSFRRKGAKKKVRVSTKSSRARATRSKAAESTSAQLELVFDGLQQQTASRYLGLGPDGVYASPATLMNTQQGGQWQLDDVPVFQLFTRVRHLLGR